MCSSNVPADFLIIWFITLFTVWFSVAQSQARCILAGSDAALAISYADLVSLAKSSAFFNAFIQASDVSPISFKPTTAFSSFINLAKSLSTLADFNIPVSQKEAINDNTSKPKSGFVNMYLVALQTHVASSVETSVHLSTSHSHVFLPSISAQPRAHSAHHCTQADSDLYAHQTIPYLVYVSLVLASKSYSDTSEIILSLLLDCIWSLTAIRLFFITQLDINSFTFSVSNIF